METAGDMDILAVVGRPSPEGRGFTSLEVHGRADRTVDVGVLVRIGTRTLEAAGLSTETGTWAVVVDCHPYTISCGAAITVSATAADRPDAHDVWAGRVDCPEPEVRLVGERRAPAADGPDAEPVPPVSGKNPASDAPARDGDAPVSRAPSVHTSAAQGEAPPRRRVVARRDEAPQVRLRSERPRPEDEWVSEGRWGEDAPPEHARRPEARRPEARRPDAGRRDAGRPEERPRAGEGDGALQAQASGAAPAWEAPASRRAPSAVRPVQTDRSRPRREAGMPEADASEPDPSEPDGSDADEARASRAPFWAKALWAVAVAGVVVSLAARAYPLIVGGASGVLAVAAVLFQRYGTAAGWATWASAGLGLAALALVGLLPFTALVEVDVYLVAAGVAGFGFGVAAAVGWLLGD